MQAGDIILCQSTGIIGRAIRWAQRHDDESPYNIYNHVAILDSYYDGRWHVIQAEAKGVTNDKTLDSVAPGGSMKVLTLPRHVDREELLSFARSQVGAEYGFTTILSCAIDMFIWDAVCLRKADTWICSGLTAAALMYGGFEGSKSFPDIYTTTPAQIGEKLHQYQ